MRKLILIPLMFLSFCSSPTSPPEPQPEDEEILKRIL